MKTFQVKL